MAPLPIGALVVLVVNDRVLKAAFGNTATGKLSDIAGVFLLPLVFVSILEVARWAIRRRPWSCSPRELVVAIAVTGVGFGATKLFGPIAEAYGTAIGVVRWVGALPAMGLLGGIGSPEPIEVVVDPTDLLVLPVLVVTYLVATSRRPLVAD